MLLGLEAMNINVYDYVAYMKVNFRMGTMERRLANSLIWDSGLNYFKYVLL